MESNQTLFARVLALQAINEAQRAHLCPPAERVMAALRWAIEDKRTTVINLVPKGCFDSPEYVKAKAQLMEWNSAWRSNR